MTSQPSTHQSKPKRRGRPRPLPPDVNARNLALEKGRREDMKKDLLELARLVPALAPVRRLVKTIIVKEGLKHFKKQREMCLAAAEDMRDLIAENHQLIAELNELRVLAGERNPPQLEPKPLTDAMIQLMNVPNEVCGAFPAGYGDNWAYETHGVQPPQRDSPVVDRTDYQPEDDILSAVEPLTQDQVLDDQITAAETLSLADNTFCTEMLSHNTRFDCSLSPETPLELPQTLSHEGYIPNMTPQIGCYMPFDMLGYPPLSIGTMPMDTSTAWSMQGIGMTESAQSTIYGNTVGYVGLEQIGS